MCLFSLIPRPLDIPCFTQFISFEPADVYSDYLEQEAAKGKGAFIQALWNLLAKFKLYRLVYKAWKQPGPQTVTTWTLFTQAVLWREMARYRFSNSRLVSHVSESDALARKDALWPCVSLALSFVAPGLEAALEIKVETISSHIGGGNAAAFNQLSEDDKAFQLNLAVYQRVDLAVYLNFKIAFRALLNTLKPSKASPFDLTKLLRPILPDYEAHDILSFKSYCYFESRDFYSDYLEEEAIKGKKAFIQAIWTMFAKRRLYNLANKAWEQQGAQTLILWTLLAQAVLDECYGQEWTEIVFQRPDACPICLSPMHCVCGQKKRSVVPHFTRVVSCNT
ncbi:hypothetical protein TNIN_497401 [Trichonephila inaurata madagascariensis]|uniref:Uncharacterized protein n=1 Tax=Trichonephila inaurata madagascariensis TaxID=2747483 RepID=A0A8X6YE00_9ARAC|nr:hypothetical protein TNIN_497401 [Trichonephila inaurata madagascariensis]